MNQVRYYRHADPPVRAIQWTGKNLAAVMAFVESVAPRLTLWQSADQDESTLLLFDVLSYAGNEPSYLLMARTSDWLVEGTGAVTVFSDRVFCGRYYEIADQIGHR